MKEALAHKCPFANISLRSLKMIVAKMRGFESRARLTGRLSMLGGLLGPKGKLAIGRLSMF